jgi:type I restriction enzyme M protein
LATTEADVAFQESELEAVVEEHAGDGGLIDEDLAGTSKADKKLRAARIAEIASNSEFADELEVLNRCTGIVEKLELAKHQVKTTDATLTTSLLTKYKNLDEAEVKRLALIKWVSALSTAIESDRSRVSQLLADRISLLGNRYDEVLETLSGKSSGLQQSVNAYLLSMGLES